MPLNPQANAEAEQFMSTEEAVPNKQVDGIEFQARDRYSDFLRIDGRSSQVFQFRMANRTYQ